MTLRNWPRHRSGWLALLLAASLRSHAGPMGFEDSWMSMGDLGPNWREVFINYAVTPRDAVGLSQTYVRSDDDELSNDLSELTYTRLLRRWNQPESQRNVWFVGGIGALQREDQVANQQNTRLAASPGIQADFETTRVYLSAMYRFYRASDINYDYASARAGFSFFEPHYEQTHPWLILEVRRMHDLSEDTEITPMLRLINRNYFIEAGINNFGQARFNFMFIF